MISETIGLKIEKHDYWKSKIKEWQASNLSQSAFCRQAGIKLSTFVYWRRQFSETENNNKFIPVKIVKDVKENKSIGIKIKLVPGHIVYLPEEIDGHEIAKLIQLIGRPHV